MSSSTLHYPSARHLSQLYAGREENLSAAERLLAVKIITREDWITFEGEAAAIASAEALFGLLNEARTQGLAIRTPDFLRFTETVARGESAQLRELFTQPIIVPTQRKSIVPKTLGQKLYLQAILRHPLVFGIGPAGTGKTYLARAVGLHMLKKRAIHRIILTRPAVEAGEALGFLPGDMKEKVAPYLRPLYDAIHDMLDPEEAQRYLDEEVIEIAPLAFMRGRTLSRSFVILDEAQNTTREQMFMALTRLGEESKLVVTGDSSQIDLKPGVRSGLHEAEHALGGIKGIAFTRFTSADIVRHPIVEHIVNAYEKYRQ